MVLHITSSFLPNSVGGKEIYVHNLALRQIEEGKSVAVLVMGDDIIHREIRVEQGVLVYFVPAFSEKSKQNYFSKRVRVHPEFVKQIEELEIEEVYFHDQSRFASISHLEYFKERRIRTNIVYHSPGQSCPNNALLYKGKTICDGLLLVNRCTSCRLKKNGHHSLFSSLAGKFSIQKGGSKSQLGSITHARYYTQLFIDSFQEYYSAADNVIVHANWVYDILVLNGVSKNKIQFLPLDAVLGIKDKLQIPRVKSGNKIQIAFVGRCVDIKGAHLIIKAVLKLSDEEKQAIKVSFFGAGWGNSQYSSRLLKIINGDPCFRSPQLLPIEDLREELKKFDVGIIPSLWPETGPIVLYDFLQAGVQVYCTKYTGVSDEIMKTYGVKIIDYNSVESITESLRKYINQERNG